MFRIASFLAFMLWGLGAPAGEVDQRMLSCAVETDPNRKIGICTEAIESGTLSAVDMVWAYNNRATAHAMLGQDDSALSDIDAALAANPGFPFAYYARGEIFLRAGLRAGGKDQTAFLDAVHAYEQALEAAALRGPQPETAYNESVSGIVMTNDIRSSVLLSRSIAYLQLGRADDAIADCQTAIKLTPSDPRAYNNLGFIYLEGGDPERAIPYYEKAVALAPTYGQAVAGLRVARERAGR